MYEALVRKARDLKRRSRKSRDHGDLEEAERLLREAIAQLEEVFRTIDEKLPAGIPAPQDIRDIAAELADCWGSLGGVLRRQAEKLRISDSHNQAASRFGSSLEAYEAGSKLEQDDRFRIANSYSLVQSVVLPLIAAPEKLGENIFRRGLKEVQSAIERQITTSRPGDVWAYSDLGLICLLLGNESTADDWWDKMDALKPERNVYTSGLPVLESLAMSMPEQAQFQRAVERFRSMA